MWETVGQILGYVGVIFAVASYQMKMQKWVLITLSIGAIIFCVHYLLIGGISGLVLNAIAVIRNVVFYFKGKKWYRPVLFPLSFAVAMGIAGVIFWEGYYSIFIMAGLMVNTVCVSFSNTQLVRASILITSPLCLTYNAFVHSYAGIINESLILTATIIGLICYAKNGYKCEEFPSENGKEPQSTPLSE